MNETQMPYLKAECDKALASACDKKDLIESVMEGEMTPEKLCTLLFHTRVGQFVPEAADEIANLIWPEGHSCVNADWLGRFSFEVVPVNNTPIRVSLSEDSEKRPQLDLLIRIDDMNLNKTPPTFAQYMAEHTSKQDNFLLEYRSLLRSPFTTWKKKAAFLYGKENPNAGTFALWLKWVFRARSRAYLTEEYCNNELDWSHVRMSHAYKLMVEEHNCMIRSAKYLLEEMVPKLSAWCSNVVYAKRYEQAAKEPYLEYEAVSMPDVDEN